MTTPIPEDRLTDIANIEMAERAQQLLDEGRHDLTLLDSEFFALFAAYLKNRLGVVREKIVPAKQILGLPAYADGQHKAVLRSAAETSKTLGTPEKLTLSIAEGVLALSVEAQLPVLGGKGVPTQADLFRAEIE